MKKTLPLTTLLLCGALACQPAPAEQGTSADRLSAAGGNQCVLITNDDLLGLRQVLADGLADAEQDALTNGAAGNYAAAATGARDAFALAVSIFDEQYAFMQENVADDDPSTTNFVEGSLIAGAMWQITEQLQQVIHWGAVSEIYHDSATARAGVEEALLASELALALQARGVRCYMDNYSAN